VDIIVCVSIKPINYTQNDRDILKLHNRQKSDSTGRVSNGMGGKGGEGKSGSSCSSDE